MALMRSYKQTEMGVIPEDWDIKKLENIGRVIRGASPRPKGDKRFYGGNIPRLMVEDVTRDGKYVTPKVDFLTEEGAKRSRPCKKGTLTVVCSGTVGIPSFLAVDSCIHDGFLALVDLNKNVHDDYLYHQLTILRDRFENSATHGGVFTNLTTEIFRNFSIPIPRNNDEQRAIAAALSDVDALLASLDALIVKKRLIKQGAMQELLTGRRRLSGFSGEWVRLHLSNDTILKARIGWQGLTTAEYLGNGDYALVTGTDFTNGSINWNSCSFVEKSRYDQDKNIQLQVGDVLLTKDGTIGKVAYISQLPYPTTLNSGVFVLRPKNNRYVPLFMYYVLRSKIFSDFLAQLQAGSTINHLYQKDFVKFTFFAPSQEEQREIATVLSSMDDEIHALELQRDKTHSLKQGMMQELLTGRTRLI
jgi:type I restriction enzyme, S subunit